MTHFIDHRVGEGLLVPGGGFVVLHLQRHQPDPQLLLLGVVLSLSCAHLRLLIHLDRRTKNKLGHLDRKLPG